MSDPHPQADPPRSDSSSDRRRSTMADGTGSPPAWNRERLISQIQQIDGSTRSEAERQVAEFERAFRNGHEEPSDAGAKRGSTG